MHLSIEVSPQAGARITAAAHRRGGNIGAVIEKLAEQLPAVEGEAAPVDQKKIDALALLESILAEVPTDPNELRLADAEFEEFKKNLNTNRIMAGETPPFP
jgi:hypothetical protein